MLRLQYTGQKSDKGGVNEFDGESVIRCNRRAKVQM